MNNNVSQLKGTIMLNEVYDTVETILESLDTGGEQSRAFADEIQMLKELLGYPEPAVDALDVTLGRCQIARKLERMAIQADEIAIDLPTLPVNRWLDGSFQDATVDVDVVTCDLARLLQFLADHGVRERT